MSDEGWRRVQALHEAEIILIAGQIEQSGPGAVCVEFGQC
jgi:hypothetical protein